MEFGSLRRGGVVMGTVSPSKSPGAGDGALGDAGRGSIVPLCVYKEYGQGLDRDVCRVI